ncbi:MAG: hypothetical protein L0G59_04970 [Kocuria sp.]|nr:hypothetical protein [Kocuria sp.]
MNANDVLDALRRHHRDKALAPEMVIHSRDHAGYEAWLADPQGREMPSQTRRIDALMFDGPQRTAIEIKVSRADVKRETWQKVAPWLEVTHRYIYAVPAGLIEGNEVPHLQAGLWWVHDDGHIEVRRKASIKRYPEMLPQHVITALAYRAAGVKIFEQEVLV